MGEKDNRQRGSVYMNICYQILDDIIKDKYSVGDLIPTQNELSERFHVSRATVREAIKELIRRGVLKAVKGKGTFVITKPGEITKDNRLDGFSGLRFRNIGREVHSKVIVIEEIPADKKLSNKLIIPQEDLVTHIRRVRYVDMIPLCVDDAYLATRYLKGIDFHKENLVTGSLYKVLETKADIYFDFVEEKYRAVSCPEELADYLEISHGEPVLAIERISCDEFGKQIEYCENYERSDLFSTVIQSRRSTQKTVEKDIYDKILGSFLGAAAGDALGAVTERKSSAEILETFGGYVGSFEIFGKKGDDTSGTGAVTDSFSQAYFLALELIKCSGHVTGEAEKNALLAWAEYPEYRGAAEPDLNAAVEKWKEDRDYDICRQKNEHHMVIASNGAAMKIFPAGLINRGNLMGAIEDAVTISAVTHPFSASIAAASAVAAAVAKALDESAGLDDVLEAGIWGAAEGCRRGNEQGNGVTAPSVEKRIRLAVDIGRRARTWEECMQELSDLIGTGSYAAESVPCAFGILAACPGDFMEALKMGVNIGDDTSVIASIVGAIGGCLYGTKSLPKSWIEVLDRVNGFDLERISQMLSMEYYGAAR